MIFELSRTRLSLLSAALVAALALASVAPALASSREAGTPAVQADELLRKAVANEKAAVDSDYFAWVDRLQKPHGSVTKLMVNTPQGILARTVEINDHALNADERRQDDNRINRLLDPEIMHEKAKKQREDQQHIERLLLALPDSFRCRYASGGDQEQVVRMECAPNPAFSPSNYESQVLMGMRAEIEIDPDEMRITRIAGTLFKDVSFGWGFVAKLNHGGRIEIVQSRVAGSHWGVTQMAMAFDGHVILVKPLHIEETETCWDYRPVPGMSVAQALTFLRSDFPRSAAAGPAH